MAYKNWLLLAVTVYLVIATAAKPQQIKPKSAKYVRVQPISEQLYESILKLNAGKPIVSEARLINNGYSAFGRGIADDITNSLSNSFRVFWNMPRTLYDSVRSRISGGSGKVAEEAVPMCVINIADVTTEETAQGRAEDETTNDDDIGATNDQKVKCIVVVKTTEKEGDKDGDAKGDGDDAATDCQKSPFSPQCCDPNTSVECFCAQNPTNDACLGQVAQPASVQGYSGNLYNPNLMYSYVPTVPNYNYPYGYAVASGRAAPARRVPVGKRVKASEPNRVKPQNMRKNKPVMVEMTRKSPSKSSKVPEEASRSADSYPHHMDETTSEQSYSAKSELKAQLASDGRAQTTSDMSDDDKENKLRYPVDYAPSPYYPYDGYGPPPYYVYDPYFYYYDDEYYRKYAREEDKGEDKEDDKRKEEEKESKDKEEDGDKEKSRSQGMGTRRKTSIRKMMASE